MDASGIEDILNKWKVQNEEFRKETERLLEKDMYYYNLGWLLDYLTRHPELDIELSLTWGQWHFKSCAAGEKLYMRTLPMSCKCGKALEDPKNFIKAVRSYREFAEMMRSPRKKKKEEESQ